MSDPILPGEEAGLREAIAAALFEHDDRVRSPDNWVSWAEWLKLASPLRGRRAFVEIAAYRARADALLAGPLAQLQSDRTRLEAENERLRDALHSILKPFPAACGAPEDMLEDWISAVSRFRATARSALAQPQPEEDR